MSRQVKDSGIPWAQFIPTDWDTVKGKYCLKYLEKPVRKDDEVITCFRDGVVTLRKNRREEGFTISEKEIGYQGIDVGDLVVHGMDGFAGAIGISDSRGKSSPVLNVLDTTQNKKYIMYYLRTLANTGVFLALSTGIRVRTCDTNWGKLKELVYTLPPIKEQHRISTYLDKKCAEVDGLRSNIQKQIEALEQYKRAVITETVTKGLNPSAPMKDSGIPWIGQIPKHWGIKRIKFCCELSPKFHNKLSPNTLVSFLPMECVKQGFLVIEKEAELQDVKNGYTYFRENDIIMAKVTPCFENGNIAIAKGLLNNVGFGSSELYVFRPHKISVPFLFYFLQNTIFKNQAQSVMYGTGGLKRVPSEFIKNYQFACPPQSEQQAIAEYLDNKCSKIDTIIQDEQQQLEKLEQYKKATIFEYVTGKKQVPEV